MFRQSIRKLGILNANLINDYHLNDIHRKVNEHCSDSLISFTAGILTDEKTLANYNESFTELVELSLSIAAIQVESILPFDKIFPKLQHLTLGLCDSAMNDEFNASRFIGSEVPHI